MAKRVNMLTGVKEPKPSATERTWSRWRIRKNIETPDDNLRLSRLDDTKDRIAKFLGRKRDSDNDLVLNKSRKVV